MYVEKEKVLGQREKKMNLRGEESVETYSKYNTEQKEKVLGQREKKMNLRGKESVETYSKYNTELICLYL